MKIVRLAIFLTGITGLAMGGIMTLSSLRSGQEEAALHSNESLKTQATQFVDQFFGMLEASKNLSANSTAIPSYVTHRAVLLLNQNAPAEFESFNSTDSSAPVNAGQTDFGLQERVQTALKNDLSLPDLQISRMTMGTYSLTDIGNKEGIYIATPIYKVTNGVTDPTAIEKINLTLIDPVKAFGGLQKLSSSQDSAAFLVSKKGKVLAHSVSAYVGTDLKHTETLKDTIENLFLGAQTGSVGKYTNADGVQEHIAFVRAGTSPFAFAVEQKVNPAVLSSAWFSDQVDSGAARKNFGFMFLIIAASLLAFSGISVWASREVGKQISNNAYARQADINSPKNNSIPTIPADLPLPLLSKLAPSLIQASKNPSVIPPPVAEASAVLVEARDQIALEQEQLKAAMVGLTANRDYARDFLSKIENGYTLEGIEKELVQVSSEISESPVLYFRYHRRNQSLSLSAVAGDVKIANYSNMHAYIRKDIELQVEQMADEGKVASISNYGPMSKLIISHLNVAHFEAWAVTSHPEVSGKSKLVGVVVVLQAGMRSAQARPLIARILKDAGNYLYAQSNKIRPRSSLFPNANSPKIEDSDLT
jgi:hypothetical protein